MKHALKYILLGLQLLGSGAAFSQGVAVRREEVAGLVAASAAQVVADALASETNSFAGNASGATNLNASELRLGTIPDARISSDITRDTELTAALAPFVSLQRLVTNVFNVKDYGAVADGTTAADLAFQSALNDAQTNGGTVLVPDGVYAFRGLQPDTTYLQEGHMSLMNVRSNNVILRGAGRGKTIFLLPDNLPTPPAGDAYWNFIGSRNCTNLIFEEFTIDANNKTGLADFTQISFHDNVMFRNVNFKNGVLGDAVDTENGGTVIVDGCEFYNIEGNCLSTVDQLFIARNCRGKGIGTGLEFRSRDGAQVPASILQSYSVQTRMSGCVWENFSVALDQFSGTVTMDNCYFNPTNVAATTNFWVSGGTLRMNGVTVNSAANFSTGHLIAVNTNGSLYLDSSFLDGKRQIQATKPAPGGIAIRVTSFGTVTLNNNNAIALSDGTGALIEGCTFLGNGYRAVSVDGPLPFHNVRVVGGIFNSMSVLVDTAASTNFFCDGAYFQFAGVGFWAGSGHAFQNNTMVGAGFPLNMGGAQNTLIENNQLDSISFFSSQPVTFRQNRIANPTISGTVGQINASRWEDNRTIAGLPLRTTTHTANYTADALDSVLIFNGANLTNTIPSMGTINDRKMLTIKNRHSTPLEVTNATGSVTFDGRLRFSVPPYASRQIVTDGANWFSVDDDALGGEVAYRLPLKAVSVNVAVAMQSVTPFFFSDSMRFSTNGNTSIHFPPNNSGVSNYVIRTVWHAPGASSYPQTIPLEYYANYFVNTSGRIFNQNHITTNLVFTAEHTLLTNTVAMNTATNVLKEFAIQVLAQNPSGGPQYLYLVDCIITEKPNAP
jgi:hypothetical protein